MRGHTKEIYEIIKKAEEITLTELSASTTTNYNTLRGVVIRLTNTGLIERVGKGVYRIKRGS